MTSSIRTGSIATGACRTCNAWSVEIAGGIFSPAHIIKLAVIHDVAVVGDSGGELASVCFHPRGSNYFDGCKKMLVIG